MLTGAPPPTTTEPRLPWRRLTESSFVAHPFGRERPNWRAWIGLEEHDGARRWKWVVTAGSEQAEGWADSKQSAADVATATWPLISNRQIAAAPTARLADELTRARKAFDRNFVRQRDVGALEAFMAALSDELLRRR
jgi:hypothetical protein